MKRFHSVSSSRSPEKQALSNQVAKQMAEWEAKNGPIKTLPNGQVKDSQPVQDGKKHITIGPSKQKRREMEDASLEN